MTQPPNNQRPKRWATSAKRCTSSAHTKSRLPSPKPTTNPRTTTLRQLLRPRHPKTTQRPRQPRTPTHPHEHNPPFPLSAPSPPPSAQYLPPRDRPAPSPDSRPLQPGARPLWSGPASSPAAWVPASAVTIRNLPPHPPPPHPHPRPRRLQSPSSKAQRLDLVHLQAQVHWPSPNLPLPQRLQRRQTRPNRRTIKRRSNKSF